MEKSGKIAGHDYFIEPFQPRAITAHVPFVANLEQLKFQFPLVKEAILKQFSNLMHEAGHDGLTSTYPIRVGVFLFDPGTPLLKEGAPGYRKPGAKMGNYGAENPFAKDEDPVKIAEKVFDLVEDGIKDPKDNVDAKGVGLQFSYFAPLHVQIGLEFGLRSKDGEAIASNKW